MRISSGTTRVAFRWMGSVILLVPFFLPLPALAGLVSKTDCGYMSMGNNVGSYHCASLDGFGTTTITALALAEDVSRGGFSTSYSLSDSANLDAMIFTSGPVRAGFMEISVRGDGEFGSVSEQVGSWSCSGPIGFSCFSPTGPLPVTLGIPIELTIQAAFFYQTGSARGTVQLSLFEATGSNLSTPGNPVILLSASPAPEPVTGVLLLSGLVVLGVRKLPVLFGIHRRV